ncbi:MAG: STAS/SEC14 domain-containing protein [Candidatus Eremiobacteraeota bacterium]|nr:STAS/SEC14 domain-containing protein [Candidatus Eremiobacteraeota bacterium]
MLEILEGLDPDTVGIKAIGNVTADDYKTVLEPAVEEVVASGHQVRLVYVLGPEFENFELGAMHEDSRIGLAHLTDFERVAFITSHNWFQKAMAINTWMIPCPVRVFPMELKTEALKWAQSGREDTLEIEIIPAENFTLFELRVTGSLGYRMEQKLVETMESSIDDSTNVRLLVRAHDFHGWNDIRALYLHLKLVLGVHRQVEKLVIVGEETWQRRVQAGAQLLFGIDARFYDLKDYDEAKKWALAPE